MTTTKNKQILQRKILPLVAALVLIIVDQLLKLWALETIRPAGSIEAIPGILQFTYLANTGAAGGIFKGYTTQLAFVSLIFLIIIVGVILSGKITDHFLIWTLSLLVAGGGGNMVDRFYRGFVVDFLDLEFWIFKNFPIFNFADICVTVGAGLLIIYIIISENSNRKQVPPHTKTEQPPGEEPW